MKYNPNKHHRRSIRLPSYDYSQSGAYFITMVIHVRECILGEIVENDMQLSQFGKIVEGAWLALPQHYPHMELGTFCVMPNHVHAVIIITDLVRAGLRPALTAPPFIRHPLSEIIRAWKSFSARRINQLRNTPGVPIWQRNYYEHIIRNDEEHNRIHLYIESNVSNWDIDNENPFKKI